MVGLIWVQTVGIRLIVEQVLCPPVIVAYQVVIGLNGIVQKFLAAAEASMKA